MKKIFLCLTIFSFTLLFSQNKPIKENFSTNELINLYQTIPKDHKSEFYNQYLKALIFEEMKLKFNYKDYSDIVLQKLADTVLSTLYKDDTVKEENLNSDILDNNFLTKNVKTDETFNLLLQNAGIISSYEFPQISNEPTDGGTYEEVPGDIFTIVNGNGYQSGRYPSSYRIIENGIIGINTIPDNDKTFEDKLYKHIKSPWSFSPNDMYTITKTKDNEYLISTNLYGDSETEPTYDIEYKTKDFKKFVPLRISKLKGEKKKWKVIK